MSRVARTCKQAFDLCHNRARSRNCLRRINEHSIAPIVATIEIVIECQSGQRRRDQRNRIVVQMAIEITLRTRRVAIPLRTELRRRQPRKFGRIDRVDINQTHTVRRADDVFGFQITVRPLLIEQPQRQPIELSRQTPQSLRIALNHRVQNLIS